jgi:hypothetical protein
MAWQSLVMMLLAIDGMVTQLCRADAVDGRQRGATLPDGAYRVNAAATRSAAGSYASA